MIDLNNPLVLGLIGEAILLGFVIWMAYYTRKHS